MANLLELAQFLAAPFVLCLILAGIHCYLGLHVLARGIIFIDLSLAQVSALGASLGMLLDIEMNTPGNYFFSLAFTFLASGLFSFARRYEHVFSQEALIGILYAFSAAAVILFMDRMAHGAERVKDLLVGQILWVTWSDTFKTMAIYSGVALLHYIFREKFMSLSFATGKKASVFWDFLFYVLFGVVITSSVRLAGVLLVFTYLIVPAFLSSVYFKSIKARLIFGWIFGSLASLLGMALSYQFDFPAGAFIVVVCAAVPIILVVTFPIFSKKKERARSAHSPLVRQLNTTCVATTELSTLS